MLPFAHATRVMIVDDDQLFLDSFEYAYHSVLNCVTEANPQGALESLSRNSAAWSKRLSAAAPTRNPTNRGRARAVAESLPGRC